jgi:hypothetical protein
LRKLMMLAVMLAMAAMMAAPATAMADDFDGVGFEDFIEDFGFFTPFAFEVEDVDCDGFDDDFDGGIDEDVVCVVEFEVEDFD